MLERQHDEVRVRHAEPVHDHANAARLQFRAHCARDALSYLEDARGELVRQHCVLGAQHLGQLAQDTADSSTVAVAVALSHHEWWNGLGYPFGLAGSAIPRCARIVAVVDVFDALMSERPYKKAWSLDATLSYIAQGSGTQFDPECVDALLACAWDLPPTWRSDAQAASLDLLAELASPRFATPSPSKFVGLWPQDA